jgi:hypothetical protein
MSLERTMRAIAGRLSLREPQTESLRRLAGISLFWRPTSP